MKVAVVGGTGDFGLALGRQLAAVGEAVVIGSRDADAHVRCRCAAASRRGCTGRGARVKIAVVGGTGDFGLALGRQLAAVGESVVIGSREAERARDAADRIGAAGASNEDAVRGVDLVVLAVKAEAALPMAA